MIKHQSPAPTNGVILVNKKGDILLVRRAKNPKKGYWDLPGGFVETGESMEDSIKREIKEELGINVSRLQYLSSFPDKYFYNNVYEDVLGFVFVAHIDTEKGLKPADDVSACKFFPKEKIPFERLAFPSLKRALKKYLNTSRSRKS